MNKLNRVAWMSLFLCLTACDPDQATPDQAGAVGAKVKAPISGVQWLEARGEYIASDSSYPVGQFKKMLTLDRKDIFIYVCNQADPETGKCLSLKKELSHILLLVKFTVKENQFISKNVTGVLSFSPAGLLLTKSKPNDEVILTESGDLLVREFWDESVGGDPDVRQLRAEDRFRLTEGKLLGQERLYDERGEKVIYEQVLPFIPSVL